MDKLTITPGKLKGEVKIPPSKSMAHRAVICASLSKGKSKITNIEFSEDIIATIEAMKSLGTEIKVFEDYLEIDGENTFTKSERLIDCNESGSTLRFMVPIALVKDSRTNFIGKGNLGKRPLNTYYEIFDRQCIKYDYEDGVLDLNVEGELKGEEFKVRGDISSQFISGLLFSLPLLKEDSKITITTKLESKGYIDLTLSMLKLYGIEIINNDYREFIIKGNQSYKAKDYRVEGDYSQAAFFLVADTIGSDVIIKDLNVNSLQGDKEILDIIARMGGEIEENAVGIKVATRNKKNTVIDASQCPDIIPVLTVLAAVTKGTTNIINAERLRIKECDRLKAISTELNKLGANVKELENSLVIEGVASLNGGIVHSWNDHRIAMSLAIAATCCTEKVTIENPGCVKKSYPSFWRDYKSLGGKINEWSLGQ
ncbi:3-phosphoshikimate 1-carboxyvinyltransferase [Clostridium sp. 'White wine YQ']|uniref:3-phosphoshikimate 1-carboxyvinyltransferase n=1 Tax=Clostridium sp. 'White wine YQ' TaxID=3027474 RepID=UPI0023653022|nr:3-phosphoshikimate 1-carboxyvinyltransferase [Clostridium sp. 'White wine YQ']MDD7794939.1 3-phosphoshikimate 1-carboxyvinyltransferase [Clostridium sp. 'White wine YQ']